VALGVVFGLCCGWSALAYAALRPFIEIGRTISPLAWIPLAVLWFGIGNAPAIFIIAVSAFCPVFVATQNAQRNIDRNLVLVALNFGATLPQLFWRVIIPASFPQIVVGLRIALAISWMVIVAAEMVGMRSGLGYLILDSRNMLRIDLVIACMLVIGGIGLVLDCVMNRWERRVFRYRNGAG
jgi:NitT/TauT family transport system permease protein